MHVIKTTGTYADTLLALGAAELLDRLANGEDTIQLVDRGDAFELRGAEQARPRRTPGPLLLYPFVSLTPGDDTTAPGEVIRYAEERQRSVSIGAQAPRRTRRGRRRAAAVELPQEIADAVMDREALSPRSYLVARLNAVDRGRTVERGNGLRGKLGEVGNGDLDLVSTALAAGWARQRPELAKHFGTETLGQVLNPHAGKGTNRPKPTGTKRDNLRGPAVEEWLKCAGLYWHAYARRIKKSQSSADEEVLVPIPEDIAVDTARVVMERFREEHIGGESVKFEILAVLSYTDILVRHHRANFADALYRRRRVNRIVSGIQVAYFQDLGGNKAVTGVYTLGLPGWLELETAQDVETYLSLLHEHRVRVKELDEGRWERERFQRRESAPASLFFRYREFLSDGDLRSLAVFLIEHGQFVMRSWAADDRRKPGWFGEQGLIQVVRGGGTMRLVEVVANDGFRNIARAIRRSTISEVMQQSPMFKHRLGGVRYDVRYGLGQELKRRARKPEEFLAALAAFVQSYNEENSRIREQFSKHDRELPAHRRRFDISDTDLDAVVRLLDDAGDPEMVALLLVAYGFAKADRGEGEGDTDDRAG